MNEDDVSHFGFKRITTSNWKEIDDIIQFPSPVREETWVRACLEPQLDSAVPEDIKALFEVARGSMIYGWFFYPLITLATEQGYRVLESAARAKCRQLGLCPATVSKDGKTIEPPFTVIIDALAKQGVISAPDKERWGAGRRLRNAASHPESQSICDPGQGLNTMTVAVELINKLFP